MADGEPAGETSEDEVPSGTDPGSTPIAKNPHTYRYDAFISYSHALDDEDEKYAPLRRGRAVQHGLHRLTLPWFRRRQRLRVFLDETSLGAGEDVWQSIEDALRGSGYFILMASPEAAESENVQREVDHWCANRDPDSFLIALMRGDIRWDEAGHDFDWEHTTALPRSMSGYFANEPKWVDLDWVAESSDLTLRNRRFASAISSLAAPLFGQDKDRLYREDERGRRRALSLTVGVLSVLTVLMMIATAVAVWQRGVAVAEAEGSLSRQLAAQSASLTNTSPDLASLLAVNAYQTSRTPEAVESLYRSAALPLERRLPGATYLYANSGRAANPLPMIVSGDGRIAAIATDGGVSLQLTDTGHTLSTAKTGPYSIARAMAFDREDRILATGYETDDSDPGVNLWDVATGNLIRSMSAPKEGVERLEFSDDGGTLVGGGFNGEVTVWDVATGDVRSRFAGFPRLSAATAISRDHRSVAMSHENGELGLWTLPKGRDRERLSGKGAPPATAMQFSPDSKTLAVGRSDGAVQIWNTLEGEPVRTIAGRMTTRIRSLSFSPDGGALAAANDDGTVVVYDTATGRVLGNLADQEQAAGSVAAFAGDDDTLIVNTLRNVRVYDLGSMRPRTALSSSAGNVGAMVYSADGRRLLTVSDAFGSRLWNVESGKPQRTLFPGELAYIAAFDQAGRPLAVGGRSRVRILHVGSGKPFGQLSADILGSGEVALSQDGRMLATTDSASDRWRMWDTGSGRSLFAPKTELVHALLFAPDGGTIAVSEDDGIGLWDTGTGAKRKTLPKGHGDPVAFSNDGGTLATSIGTGGHYVHNSSTDGTVHLLDVSEGRKQAALTGHTSRVTAAAFTEDGRTLITGSADGTVRLWDIATGRTRATLNPPSGTPASLAISPDDRTLAVGTDAGSISLWRLALPTPKQAISKICRAVGRDLSKAEQSTYLPDGGGGHGCPAR
ncbi:WD40 repeat protein [Murinocardiopsis flavida]|uniref:WD40 repeat protein n=1 Tax=Murinocardiopsis flavida TaxID=645275 RepID=A0A2P8CRB3_9ACTN|nr:PQQ-binding-like beta-propeller repeat protein [Murinocardiopsis flavida]PSK87504.1 WD40 repeat protein [Murinocardiopsis flavida]